MPNEDRQNWSKMIKRALTVPFRGRSPRTRWGSWTGPALPWRGRSLCCPRPQPDIFKSINNFKKKISGAKQGVRDPVNNARGGHRYPRYGTSHPNLVGYKPSAWRPSTQSCTRCAPPCRPANTVRDTRLIFSIYLPTYKIRGAGSKSRFQVKVSSQGSKSRFQVKVPSQGSKSGFPIKLACQLVVTGSSQGLLGQYT